MSIFEFHDEVDADQATNDGVIEDSGDSGFEASLLNNVRFFFSCMVHFY